MNKKSEWFFSPVRLHGERINKKEENMFKKPSIMAFAVIVLFVVGCPQGEIFKGDLTIYFQAHLDKTITPPEGDTEVDHFRIMGNGPGNNSFDEEVADNTAFTKPNIVAGDWLITIEAHNAGSEVIGVGASTLNVKADMANDVTVFVNPVDGEGTFSLTVSYDDQAAGSPAMSEFTSRGALTSLDGTRTIPLTMNSNETEKRFETSVNVTNGYYTIELEVKRGATIVKKYVDVLWIVTGLSSEGKFEFKYVASTGDIVIRPIVDLNKPLDVSICNSNGTVIVDLLQIDSDQSIAVTAKCASIGDVEYSWYLEGTPVAQGETCSLSGLDAGEYSLMLIAKLADNKCAGSESIIVKVTEAPPAIPTYVPHHDVLLPCSGTGCVVTYTMPSGISIAWSRVTVIGGGGGGDGGYQTYSSGVSAGGCDGGGGGSGCVGIFPNILVPGVTYNLSPGRGGAGGFTGGTNTNYDSNPAGDGVSTSFKGGGYDYTMSGGKGASKGTAGQSCFPGVNGTCWTCYFGSNPPCSPPPIPAGGSNGQAYGNGGQGGRTTGDGSPGQDGAVIIEWQQAP